MNALRLTLGAQADADDLDVVRATFRGLKQRYDKTGSPPSFIHTVRYALRLIVVLFAHSFTC